MEDFFRPTEELTRIHTYLQEEADPAAHAQSYFSEDGKRLYINVTEGGRDLLNLPCPIPEDGCVVFNTVKHSIADLRNKKRFIDMVGPDIGALLYFVDVRTNKVKVGIDSAVQNMATGKQTKMRDALEEDGGYSFFSAQKRPSQQPDIDLKRFIYADSLSTEMTSRAAIKTRNGGFLYNSTRGSYMTLTSGVCWENRIGWMTVAHGANIGDEIHYMDPINDGGGLLYRLGQVTHRSYTPETDAALITRGTGVSVGATNLFPNGTAVHLMGGTPDKDTYVHTYGTYSGYQYSKVIESVDAAAFLDGELRDDLIIVNQTCMSGDSGSPLLHTVGNERSLSGSLWLDVFAGNGTVYTAYGKMNHVISTWRDFSTTAY